MNRIPETTSARRENWRRFYALRREQRREAVGGKNPTGLKRFYVPGLEGFRLTPFGAATLSRRRAARKVAHESRRRNRV